MKYSNPYYRKIKNTYPLLVSCQHCKQAIALYQKRGRGNLIKLQVPRIIEAEFDLTTLANALLCPNCQQQLGSLADYRGNPTYFLLRGMTHSKRVR